MKECIFTFPVGIAMQKDSIYLGYVNRGIRLLIEGGFVGKWFVDTLESVGHVELSDGSGFSSTFTPFRLSDLKGHFVLAGISASVCLIAFSLEVAFRFLSRRQFGQKGDFYY